MSHDGVDVKCLHLQAINFLSAYYAMASSNVKPCLRWNNSPNVLMPSSIPCTPTFNLLLRQSYLWATLTWNHNKSIKNWKEKHIKTHVWGNTGTPRIFPWHPQTSNNADVFSFECVRVNVCTIAKCNFHLNTYVTAIYNPYRNFSFSAWILLLLKKGRCN